MTYKTSIFIAAITILSLFSFSNVKADGPEKNPPAQNSEYRILLEKQIQNLVLYPEFAKQQGIEGFVLISFSFNENGSFVLDELNSNNQLLSDYVVSKMKDIKMCIYAKQPRNEFVFKFDFRLI
ncbi:MAG: hypothetical protein V2A54_00615 [Bacteroidota bacterium]